MRRLKRPVGPINDQRNVATFEEDSRPWSTSYWSAQDEPHTDMDCRKSPEPGTEMNPIYYADCLAEPDVGRGEVESEPE